MRELRRSDDTVYLGWARSVLKAADIESFLLDNHSAYVIPAIGSFQRRLMVLEEDYDEALQILQEAENSLGS